MPAPLNLIKQKLLQHESTIGCWLTLASPAVAEALAHCGFDWLLIDAEHGPNDIQDVLAQLQAIDAARANGTIARAVVRMSRNNAALVKRVMDCGDAGHILVSKTVAASQVPSAQPLTAWTNRICPPPTPRPASSC